MKKLSIILALFMGSLGGTVSSDAQLLSHLKNIRAELISIIDANISGKWEMVAQFSQEEKDRYSFYHQLLHQFFGQAQALRNIMFYDIAHPEFDLICENSSLSFIEIQNKFDSLSTWQRTKIMVPVKGGLRAQDPVEISEEVRQELFGLFTSLFAKISKEYSENNQYIFQEKVTNESIKSMFEDMLDVMIWHPESLMYSWPLLKLVDVKIEELEKSKA